MTLNRPHLIGNQDDILVNAQQKYNVKQVSGKVPYGNLTNCFNLIDEQSVNYIDVPDSNPVVIELDFTKTNTNVKLFWNVFWVGRESKEN